MKVLLDAFGGDNSPDEIIKGAFDAAKNDIEVILCGNSEKIKEVINKYNLKSENISIAHADGKVESDDDPIEAIKKKKDSSMVVGLNLLNGGEADAFVSAGNTGALFTGATLIVKRIKGVKRAAIGTILPTTQGPSLLFDTGANVSLKPEYYKQLAIMGSIYMETVLNIKTPRVGLLNIGTEENKGTETIIEAYKILKNSNEINFIGNFEVRDILKGGCDVMVCDGFTGNVILKTIEGTAKELLGGIKSIFMKNAVSKLCALALKNNISGFKSKFDYKEYGGAPIIGLNKPVIKAHGSSDAKAISNAILKAKNYIELDVIKLINQYININE